MKGLLRLTTAVALLALVLVGPVPARGQSAADPPCCIDPAKIALPRDSLPIAGYTLTWDIWEENLPPPTDASLSAGAKPTFYLREWSQYVSPDVPHKISTEVYPLLSRDAAARKLREIRDTSSGYSAVGTAFGIGDEAAVWADNTGVVSAAVFRRGRYVVRHSEGGYDNPSAPPVSALDRVRGIVSQLDAELAKQVAALPTATRAPAAQETDSLVTWRQALANAPLPTATGITYDRPVSSFPARALVPPPSSFANLKAGVGRHGSGQVVYFVQVGGGSIEGYTGSWTRFSATPSCPAAATYCAEPPDQNGSVSERFGNLAVRGRSGRARHRVWPDGGSDWMLQWYDPDTDTTYWWYPEDSFGTPARIAESNSAFTRSLTSAADRLLAPYAGTVEGVTGLRDLGAQALAAGSRPDLRRVANGLRGQVVALAAPTAQGAPAEAAAYQRTTREWAELLLGGAYQAWAELWRQDARALAGAADYPALERALAEAEAELRRLESVVPASLLATWYGAAVAALRAEIATARAIAAGLTTVQEATDLGWGVVPIFPALTDLPIDAGLLPVPQEFQVWGPEPGTAYYNVPPNTLWGVARAVGPSCGLYPSPYGASRGIVRWGTYGYSGCVQAGVAGQPARFEAPVLPTNPPTRTPTPTRTRTPTPTPTRTAQRDPWQGEWTGTFSGTSSRTTTAISGNCGTRSVSGPATVHIEGTLATGYQVSWSLTGSYLDTSCALRSESITVGTGLNRDARIFPSGDTLYVRSGRLVEGYEFSLSRVSDAALRGSISWRLDLSDRYGSNSFANVITLDLRR